MPAAMDVTQEPAGDPRSVQEYSGLIVLALLAFAVGGTSGLVGAVFRLVLERSDRFRGMVIDWAHGNQIAGFACVIGFSAIATGLAAWLVRKFAPGAKGSGIPDVEAVLRDEQPPPPLVLIPVKFLGGVLAMGAGLALGREGPTIQMGAALGHFLATVFRRNQDDVKALLAAGAGAGLATAFSAPVAGAVFVLEELVRRFDTRITITTLCASGSAIAVARLLLGNQTDFQFAPLLVLGAQSGLVLGTLFGRWFPYLAERPAAFAVVGMAAFFTAVVRAPVTGIILVTEMTGSFTLLLPMLLACFAAMTVPALLGDPPIYDSLTRYAVQPRTVHHK
jgi:chloride channel protein, CIC family